MLWINPEAANLNSLLGTVFYEGPFLGGTKRNLEPQILNYGNLSGYDPKLLRNEAAA